MTIELRTPYTADGLRWTHFFNGRLLAGDDLGGDQRTTREAVRRLGEAVGGGVAWGLEVAGTPGGNSIVAPTVTVQPGLAVNPRGQTLALASSVEISLLRGTGSDAAVTAPGAFGACEPPQAGVYVAGAGVYVLVMAPVQTQEGRAPVSGLGNAPATCASRSIVDGVVFRLVQLRLTDAELTDAAHLRNLVTYRWFGDGDATAVRDPFGPGGVAQRELDRLNALTFEPLTDCDVPLAFVYWTSGSGLIWVDSWGARRPITVRRPDSGWPIAVEERRWAAGLALLLQFQAQLDTLRTGAAFTLRASHSFTWLPPVGIVPLGRLPGDPAFSQLQFFTGLKTRGPLFIEGARVTSFLHWALTFPPIDLRQPELIWLYWVRENQQPQSGRPAPAPYLIFARGQLEYQGEPRFNVSRWSYSNFSLGGIRTGT